MLYFNNLYILSAILRQTGNTRECPFCRLREAFVLDLKQRNIRLMFTGGKPLAVSFNIEYPYFLIIDHCILKLCFLFWSLSFISISSYVGICYPILCKTVTAHILHGLARSASMFQVFLVLCKK